jgi:hypothetical protein
MAKDALTDSLSASVGEHLAAGRWSVQAIAGGPSLDKARTFLRGFEIEPTDQTVIIVCERQKDPK